MNDKSFALIHQLNIGPILAPTNDLVSSALVDPTMKDEFDLSLNGKKNNIRLADFIAAANFAKLDNKQQQNIFNKMLNSKYKWNAMDRY